jgi:uncharacterized protein (TIGR03084 family)
MLNDLLAEYRELADLCVTLSAEDWRRPSAFYGWSAWDEIAHLCYFDETAYASATDPERFAREAKLMSQRTQAGEEMSALAREVYGHLDGPALLAHWRPRFESLATALGATDPKARLAWYGPPMSARSFITARLMETWAHGQDVWDLMRRRRPGNARLKHIAHLGVSTFGWSFINRKLPVPDAAPFVRLAAPAEAGGGEWTWGDPASGHHVSGSALDFCLLVTQRRHVADTGLVYTPGPVADWLAIAQCFAGAPADGPAPGARQVVYG